MRLVLIEVLISNRATYKSQYFSIELDGKDQDLITLIPNHTCFMRSTRGSINLNTEY
jgi:hypothetical protein